MEEIFEIFDEKNELIDTAPRSEVHEKGFFHRGMHGFLVNSEGKIFIQKRTKTKDTAPDCWCITVGEHLTPGQSIEAGIKRGLKEELGMENTDITLLRGPKPFRIKHDNGKFDNEFNALFLIESDEKPIPDEEELADGRFFGVEEIKGSEREKHEIYSGLSFGVA